MAVQHCRLGVNIDHIGTLREARQQGYPDPLRALPLIKEAGASLVTVHVREDRRHMQEDDVRRLMGDHRLPVNLEIAPRQEMVDIAIAHSVDRCCLVPENRQELTTEGGLDVVSCDDMLVPIVRRLRDVGIHVSLFIEPSLEQVNAAHALSVDSVELHSGVFARTYRHDAHAFETIRACAAHAHSLGLACHAGHGLSYDSASLLARIPHIIELNIGHFLMGEAVFYGLRHVVEHMLCRLKEGRESGIRG
ncbi:MAG: pyridoxine 5'-phosphate synthase [Alphaproteobacteria bacterium GM7ARS4]|nr:pyridoxine 5'-phosphate synthase [Alphaproteobacteria bacterium GM7ARS4]